MRGAGVRCSYARQLPGNQKSLEGVQYPIPPRILYLPSTEHVDTFSISLTQFSTAPCFSSKWEREEMLVCGIFCGFVYVCE